MNNREPKLYTKKGQKERAGSNTPFVKCGKVFNPVLPLHLSKKNSPVKLTQAKVNFEGINKPCIFIDFSCFVTSILRDDRFNNLVFALVRTCDDHSKPKVLNVWPFRRVFENDVNIKEPVVFNYCDCMNRNKNKSCTYTLLLIRAKLSDQSSYDITNKIMIAQVYRS